MGKTEDRNANNPVETEGSAPPVESVIGRRIRALRNKKRLSLRKLSEASGLNINTLSLIENGKTSPSVSTLQQLALALNVPLVAFFESEPAPRSIVFTSSGERPKTEADAAILENLGIGLPNGAMQPFVVTLPPEASSGERNVVHTGYEFVFCLSGCVIYEIDGMEYTLQPGDSLIFEAHLPHCWRSGSSQESQFLLAFSPADGNDEPSERHYISG